MRGIAGLVLVASSIAVAAQQEVPRFRSGVDVVQFTVTVLDKERRPVTGLTAADFEVLVDGKPRPIAAFAGVTLPDDTRAVEAPARFIPPDVHTNRLSREGRLVVIVMDRSIGIGAPLQAAHAIASAAIGRLGPADLAGVVYTASGLRMNSHGLTNDRARLRAAIARTAVGAVEEPPPPPSLAEFAASRGAPPPPKAQTRVQLASNELSGECPCGVCVPDTLTALAKTLRGGMARHKSILFVGSDIALTSQDPTAYCAAYIYPARERLTRALDEANVTFHVVDPRGLEGLGETAELTAPIGRTDMATNMLRTMTLEILPDYTGGRTVTNSNKPADAVAGIFDESRAYYVIAVARDAAGSALEDRHQIKIAVKRSDATVRARKVYFSGDPKADRAAPSAAAAALGELLPKADFALEMNLVPQFAKDGSTEVRVLLGVEAAVAGKLDVLIGAFDRTFKPVGAPVKQRLDVPAGAVAGAAAFQWTSVVKPPPGDYEIRAAVATADGTRAASVIGYTEVPDVRTQGLVLSGIVVKSAGEPTIRRGFAPRATIGLAFQIARPKGEASRVTVRSVLSDQLGQVVSSTEVPSDRPNASGVVEHEITVELPPAAGRYVARVEASDGRYSVRREVPLTVR
jgi:VWFA-related protein